MKLLLENWRKYILLENLENVSKLAIFDFDETLFFSKGYIDVVDTESGEEFQITTQEEYDKLKKDPKYEFDYSGLDNVSGELEIKPVTRILRRKLQEPETQVLVLTARSPESLDDMQRALNMTDRPINTSDIIMVGMSGDSKGEFVFNDIIQRYPNIREIEFYDDSMDNIRDMSAARERASLDGNVEKFDIYHVREGEPEKHSSLSW